ncbi:MAG: stage II sporulation protein P [Lachnospiraceae bacterium]|nr:stage II sporulation protein P [Lachnospiraceae bacterium]
MRNSAFKYNCIMCFILVFLCIYGIAKREDISQILIYEFRNEILPLSQGNYKFDFAVDEFFPILAMDGVFHTDEGVKSNEVFSEVVFATQTDAISVVAEENATTEYSLPEEDVDTELAMNIGTPTQTGIEYSMEELNDFNFLVSNCYVVDSSTSVNPEELNANNLLGMDMTIDISSQDYKVLIYHTHGSEAFADSEPGVMEDTIIGVGDELTRILEEDYGIKVYHDRNVYDVIDGELDRSKAYDMSGLGVDEILAQYPSIEVIIDLHRDGVGEDVHLVTDVDGEPTAKIMFLNGVSRLNVNGDIDYLYNPNKISNLAFSLQMHLEGKRLYGDLMRPIYIRGYRFNLDKMPRATLVEVGAQTNTVAEVKNAMTPLAAILYSVLSQK